MKKRNLSPRMPSGISLLEILAVLTLVGILAVMVLPRLAGSSHQAKVGACHVNKGNIEVQCQLWQRNKGSWPAANLSDIGADGNYFPEGLPSCPMDESSYSFDATTEQVNGHLH